VLDGAQLNLSDSAIVGNHASASGNGGGIYFYPNASGTIIGSVITDNTAASGGGLYLAATTTGSGGTVIIDSTTVANNHITTGSNPDVFVGSGRTLLSSGNNRFTTTPGPNFTLGSDYVPAGGTINYIVTSVADTYDGTSDPLNMSLRDAIKLANSTAGAEEIWLPAWAFILTRERTNSPTSTETDESQGDIEIEESLTIRGINGSTSVAWRAGTAPDKVFELIGDTDGVQAGTNAVGLNDFNNTLSDLGQHGSNLRADFDDNGTVDLNDFNLCLAHIGNTLLLDGVVV
jgi:hypothetical protein